MRMRHFSSKIHSAPEGDSFCVLTMKIVPLKLKNSSLQSNVKLDIGESKVFFLKSSRLRENSNKIRAN